MASTIKIIIGLGLIVIAILALVGLGFLTPLAFGTKNYNSLNATQKNLMKMYIVLAWIAIGLYVLYTIVDIARGNKNSGY